MFGKMPQFYAVYGREGGGDEAYEFLPVGFSWWAALLTVFWLFFHRVWLVGAVVLFVFLALQGLVSLEILAVEIELAIRIGVSILLGFYGQELRGYSLTSKGYCFVSMVLAYHPLEAQRRFFDRVVV